VDEDYATQCIYDYYARWYVVENNRGYW
jgi:hypothetical protein